MEKSGFFNSELDSYGKYDREYPAEDFASYFSKFISNGVFPNPSTGLQVVESSPPGMSVTLKPGSAFINGYSYENTDPIVFPLDVASGSLNRKDVLFIRFSKNKREIKAMVQKGTNSASAVAPVPLRSPDYWDLCVGEIDIKAGTSRITQSLIEDKRLDTRVCGIVVGAVQNIDTHTLYLQVQSDLKEFKNVSQAEWDEWFDNIKGQLGQNPLGNIQQQVDNLKTGLNNTNSTVNQVRLTAEGARDTANSAYQKAGTAQQTANSADQKATTAQRTADGAQTTANAAMPKNGGWFNGQVYAYTQPRKVNYDTGELINMTVRVPGGQASAKLNLIVMEEM